MDDKVVHEVRKIDKSIKKISLEKLVKANINTINKS